MMLRLSRQGLRIGAALFLVLALGCGDSTSSLGGGGEGGTLGPLAIPGLWVGTGDGIRVCFYVSDDGTKLARDPLCDLENQSSEAGQSYGILVESLGLDGNGQPCSFSIDYALDVPIDRATGAFGASGIPAPDGDGELSFSGDITGGSSSGLAQWSDGEASCRVGWGAKPAVTIDDQIIGSCLDLQNCCEAILFNPAFLQSCLSVARQRDQVQCTEVLIGYPQCVGLDL